MSKKSKKKNMDFKEADEVTVEDMPAASPSDSESEEQISKVREILFGSKSRQLESSLSRLEQKMRAEQETIRQEFHERFDSLESYIKGEVKAVLEQLEREEGNRVESVERLDKSLREAGEEWSENSDKLNKRLDDSERDLRDQILQARQRLTDDLSSRTQELTDRLHDEARELRKGKADRTTMAALLNDMATRLTEAEGED